MSVPVYIILSYFSFICLPINSNLKKQNKTKQKKTKKNNNCNLKKYSFISDISACEKGFFY